MLSANLPNLLSLAPKTVLVGFGALATLVVAGLLLELAKGGSRRALPSRRGSRTAHS